LVLLGLVFPSTTLFRSHGIELAARTRARGELDRPGVDCHRTSTSHTRSVLALRPLRLRTVRSTVRSLLHVLFVLILTGLYAPPIDRKSTRLNSSHQIIS